MGIEPETLPVKPIMPPSAADPLAALIEAAVTRAVDAAIDRIVEIQTTPLSEVIVDAEVCNLLRVSRPTLRHHLNDGLPYAVLGTVRRYIRSDVMTWLRSRGPR